MVAKALLRRWVLYKPGAGRGECLSYFSVAVKRRELDSPQTKAFTASEATTIKVGVMAASRQAGVVADSLSDPQVEGRDRQTDRLGLVSLQAHPQ